MEISYKHRVQIASQRDLAQQLLQSTRGEHLSHNLPQRSSQREFAEFNLASILAETTLRMNTMLSLLGPLLSGSLEPLMISGPFGLAL